MSSAAIKAMGVAAPLSLQQRLATSGNSFEQNNQRPADLVQAQVWNIKLAAASQSTRSVSAPGAILVPSRSKGMKETLQLQTAGLSKEVGLLTKEQVDCSSYDDISVAADYPLLGVHQHVYLRESALEGLSLATRGKIEKGETIWKGPSPFCDRILISSVQAMSPEEQDHVSHYFYQISETELYGPPTEADVMRDGSVFVNHNCDPNLGWVSSYEMVAIRDIQPGEELTFDYATTETWEMQPSMQCRCGSKRCRGTVQWTDHLLPDVQARLGAYFMPHVKQRAFRQRTSASTSAEWLPPRQPVAGSVS